MVKLLPAQKESWLLLDVIALILTLNSSYLELINEIRERLPEFTLFTLSVTVYFQTNKNHGSMMVLQ